MNNYLIISEEKKTIPYFERYELEPAWFSEKRIESIGFSKRLTSRLVNLGIKTVEDVLKVNDETFSKVSGFGAGCYKELHEYLKSIAVTKTTGKSQKKSVHLNSELLPYKRDIICGDFSFYNDEEFSAESKAIINIYKEAYEYLGSKIVFEIDCGNDEVLAIVEMFQNYINTIQNEKKAKNMISDIPNNLLNLDSDFVIKSFTDDGMMLDFFKGYKIQNGKQTFREYLYSNVNNILGNYPFIQLIKWVKLDLHAEINQFFADLLKIDRELEILQNRSEGKTSDYIGRVFNISKQRCSQIENKITHKFSTWQNKNRIKYRLFLELGDYVAISSDDVINYVGSYGMVFNYLMKKTAKGSIHYHKQWNLFVIEDTANVEMVQDYVDSLPNCFNETQLTEYVRAAEETYCYSSRIVRAIISEGYAKNDNTYVKKNLLLSEMYSSVLEKHYPEGLHIYDEGEIMGFKQHVLEDYGKDLSDKTDRSVGGILARVGMQCGRGIYKIRKEQDAISEELANRIRDFIDNSTAPIIFLKTIFTIFEEELVDEGINDNYYLQGIIKHQFANEYQFNRDYILKDGSVTTIYSSIVEFVKKSKYPVSKEEINREFPGVTEIILAMSLDDPDIVNLFGLYIHSSRLSVSKDDINYIKDIVDAFLEEEEVCHCKKVYEYVYKNYPEFLKNNFITYPFSMYSLLEFLFADLYSFSRPYIAKMNVKIERTEEILKSIVIESEKLSVSDIQNFAREHSAGLYSIRDFIDSCNDTHLLISDLEVASIEYIGINETIVKELESNIAKEIHDTVSIQQLQCTKTLPMINVKWNAWLIYSALKKWGTQLEVAASNSQFIHAFPIVAPKGKLDMTDVAFLSGSHDGKLLKVDDLNNIDELVADYISFEWDGVDGL